MNKIQRLIREVLSTPPKKDSCNCGCHSCENVGNPGPVLNENLTARVSKLTAMMADKAQDKTIKILPSGYKSVTNTTLNTSVTIDVYQNKLRFFEQGGSARGAYIDITAAGAGVATGVSILYGADASTTTASLDLRLK